MRHPAKVGAPAMRGKLLTGLAGVVLGVALTLALLSAGRWRGRPSPPVGLGPGPTEHALATPLPAGFRLDGVPFEQAIAKLGEVGGVSIELDREALREAGLDL